MFARLAFLMLTVVSLSAASGQDRPNVIVSLTDDQGYGDMSCHENPWLNTPNLDQLASQSVQLEDYHVDPVCTPTRAALMTGRYCTRVGAWTVTQGRQLLRDDEVTMADVFASSGYRTGMFGKWHLGDAWPYAPRFRGFEQVVCHRAGGVDEIGNPSGNDFFDDIYYRNGKPERFDGYCTDVFFRELTRFIKSDSDRPFFAYLPLNAMHSPHTVADHYVLPFLEQGHPLKRAKFYGMIRNFDENLGRLLNTLQQLSIDKNTIVIFMGDNGTAAGVGGFDGSLQGDASEGFNAGMRGKKGSTYEGGHRVACFIRWPGQLTAGATIDELTCHRDWLPTLIELCDLQTPRDVSFDGGSIVPLLGGKKRDWPERTLFVQRQGDQPERLKRPVVKSKYPHYAVLTERWRMVDGELYDHQRDPGQRNDIAEQHPEVVLELFNQYAEHFADVFAEGKPYTRFKLGGEENPTRFTVRDWHPVGDTPKDRRVIWQQDQLGDNSLLINGFWEVEVLKAGKYEIRLSRFPADASAPMGASRAKLQFGDNTETREIIRSDTSVSFIVDLPIAKLRLQTWLTDADTGGQRGAYHVEAERLSNVKNH